MAILLSSTPCDPPRRFVVFRIFGQSLMLKDETEKVEYRIKANSMAELSHIVQYSDEQWEAWIATKTAKGEPNGEA
jgi:hypothetical protein